MFKPRFTITPLLVKTLMDLEGIRQTINLLPITLNLLTSLRKSALLESIHYSTMIEGNRLTQEEITQTILENKPLKGHERDQQEVFGYYQALAYVEKLEQQKNPITEEQIQTIHALVMSSKNKKIAPTPYRTVQNVIRDSATHRIVYLPPEAKDVPLLMKQLVEWLEKNPEQLPAPLIAALAHYQYATIHPYIDGNGRTARLLTTLILRMSSYDLKGIYSLDEYYAKNLPAYYEAIAIGESHNYYMGRADADITPWIEYFCTGMLNSFHKVQNQALKNNGSGIQDQAPILKKLDLRQRLVLSLFQDYPHISSSNVAQLLKISTRAANSLCQKWVQDNFLVVANPAKKSRAYELNTLFASLTK